MSLANSLDFSLTDSQSHSQASATLLKAETKKLQKIANTNEGLAVGFNVFIVQITSSEDFSSHFVIGVVVSDLKFVSAPYRCNHSIGGLYAIAVETGKDDSDKMLNERLKHKTPLIESTQYLILRDLRKEFGGLSSNVGLSVSLTEPLKITSSGRPTSLSANMIEMASSLVIVCLK